jgi:hypothetical protein
MRVFTGGKDPSNPSIQMSARCRRGHFVQFVKRDGPRGTYYDTVGWRHLEYGRWNLDTLEDGPSPYYDDYGRVAVRNAFVWISDNPLTQTASRSETAHFVTFAICDNIPVRRFEWDRLPDGKYVAPKEPQPTNLAELCAFYRTTMCLRAAHLYSQAVVESLSRHSEYGIAARPFCPTMAAWRAVRAVQPAPARRRECPPMVPS